mgnify:CR=1 FL=1
MRSLVPLLVFAALVAAAAATGALFTPGPWYASLERPPLAPPNWIFGPVWTALYLAIAVAAYLVWRRREDRPVGPALGLWGTQLVLNALWSWLFFGLQRPGLALAEILVLLAAILATVVAFGRISRPAAGLLVPYGLWVAFATYLNAGFWWLNRGGAGGTP